MTGFLVVEFEEEGYPVEVVPATWVFQDQTKCNWPTVHSSLRLTNLVIKGASPADNRKLRWTVFNCKVLFGTDDYQQARRAADKAAEQSDIELTDTEGILARETRVLRNQIIHTGKVDCGKDKPNLVAADPEVNNNVVIQPESTSFQALERESTSEVQAEANDQTVISATIFDSHPATEISFCTDFNISELQTFRSEFHEFQKVLLDKILKLSREVEHMSRILSRIGVSSVDASGLNLPGGLLLPLKDFREFALLNQWLEKQNNQSKLINFLRGIGGSDVPDCAKRILERVLSIELQRSINLSGQNKKIAFRKYLLRNCVIGAIRTDPEAISPTEKECDDIFIKFVGGS